MEQKTVSEMTTREILRKQLELLAEYSKGTAQASCNDMELTRISLAMAEIAKLID